jgi:oligopeptide transport system ATP-binding protein
MTQSTPRFLAISDLVVDYASGSSFGRGGTVRIVDRVSLDITVGRTLGLIGESGSGKSTVARALLGHVPYSSGKIAIEGVARTSARQRDVRSFARVMQLVPQDPYASLNPRRTILHAVGGPMLLHGLTSRASVRQDTIALLARVGIPERAVDSYPYEFSGGQRQRIVIARALSVQPKMLVLDEPVTALDVTVQAQILRLLNELQDELALTYLFIAHDLAVVEQASERIAVMYLGRLVETGPASQVIAQSAHPYTTALVSAQPDPSPTTERTRRRIVLRGELPTHSDPPSGCRFHTRCWLYEHLNQPSRCTTDQPELAEVADEHFSACHFANEIYRPSPTGKSHESRALPTTKENPR